jgi:hypothetical protein
VANAAWTKAMVSLGMRDGFAELAAETVLIVVKLLSMIQWYLLHDFLRDSINIFFDPMLPKSQDLPFLFSIMSVNNMVTILIFLYFLDPIVDIAFRHPQMLSAAMPKA